MNKLSTCVVLCAVLLAGCSKDSFETAPQLDSNKASQDEINANVAKIFGTTFDPNHDWNSTIKYTVKVTADAPLNDIVKVQILNEAPYFNDNARVLNEAKVSKGGTVTLTFDSPSDYKELVAACVSSKGIYYIKAFKAGDTEVAFTKGASARRQAAKASQFANLPDVSQLEARYVNSAWSYNAIRAQKAGQQYANANIDPWKDSGWENERIWLVGNANSFTSGDWTINKSSIYRSASITDEEKSGLETVFEALGGKKANEKKEVNLKTIRESPVYELTRNYLVSDGQNPITVSPVLMFSTDISNLCLYYYYYDPAQLEGKSEEEQIVFLKNLPKFKCVDCKNTRDAAGINDNNKSEFFKVHECLLSYFGQLDGTENSQDLQVQSFLFPKDTRIGFMLRKTKSDFDDCYMPNNEFYPNKGNNYTKKSYEKSNNGELYADGRLNVQINQYPDFKTPVAKYGMQLDDPRAAIFGANQRAYLLFEDGTDINYVDLVVELQGGLEEVEAAQEINNNVYTFCFEDRDLGDYDMNDVVIKAERLNISQVKYSVVACGAHDELYLRNINGQTLNEDTELHALFGAEKKETFINTQTLEYEPVSEIVTVDPSFSFTDVTKQLYIYNKTQKYDVKLAQKGEDPHAILIPFDFAFPKEKICIKDAYKEFNSWGENPIISTDWYTRPEDGKVIK